MVPNLRLMPGRWHIRLPEWSQCRGQLGCSLVAESSGLAGGDGFVGRAAELAVVRTAIADTASRGAGLVWIEGEAGTGKTALVAKVTAELKAPSSVLRMAGDEHCVDRPFFVTRQVGVDGADGPFAAGLSLLDRFGQARGSGPTVVVVEDMHWADRGSRLALLTAAQRLDRDAVVMLVTSRPDVTGDDGWDRFCDDHSWCRRLLLDGLGPEDVAEMGRQAGVSMTAGAVGRLHAHTKGHPLYVHTLLREVPQARLVALDGELPVPRSLEATIVARLAELPADARSLAEALSVIGEPVPLPVAGQIGGLAHPAKGLDDLLATGWVTWEPGDPQAPVAFAHPLYRAALYLDLSPTRRRSLHGAAAQMLAAGSSLAHRVAAADGVDDRLATELADRAEQEERRGARTLAARYLMWASSLGSDRPIAEHRLLDACRLWVADGQVSRAADWRHRLGELPGQPKAKPGTRHAGLGARRERPGRAASARSGLAVPTRGVATTP